MKNATNPDRFSKTNKRHLINAQEAILKANLSGFLSQKIATTLSAIDNEIQELENQKTAYQIQKKGLMQVLLTGKVRVNVN